MIHDHKSQNAILLTNTMKGQMISAHFFQRWQVWGNEELICRTTLKGQFGRNGKILCTAGATALVLVTWNVFVSWFLLGNWAQLH